MSTYSTDPDKGTGLTEQTNWHDCGVYEVGPNSGNSPDGLNGSLSLSKQDREATGVEQGDKVLLKVETNGGSLITERKIVGGGRQVTLPASKRRELDLSAGDSIQYAIIPLHTENQSKNEAEGENEDKDQVDSVKSSVSENGDNESTDRPKEQYEDQSESTSADGRNQQQTLEAGDENNSDKYYVLIKGDDYDPWTYHQVQSENSRETVCGIDYSDEEHRTSTELSGFELCPFCTTQDLEEMGNNQKLKWLGRRAGFEVNQEVAYVKGPQYDALIRYIQELEGRVQEQ